MPFWYVLIYINQILWFRYKDVQLQRQKKRYKDASYSYNKINRSSKISPVGDDEIQIICTRRAFNKIIYKMANTLFFHKQVMNIQNDIYIIKLVFPEILLLLLFCEYLWSINHTDLVKIFLNRVGVIVNHPVPPVIIVDNNRDHITNLHLIINVKIIVMIELYWKLLPIMHMKVWEWIIKVSFI